MKFTTIYAGKGIGSKTWQFETNGGRQLLQVSGSAYTKTKNTDLSIDIIVNSQSVGVLFIHSNDDSTHRAFVPISIPLTLVSTSSHTLELRPSAHCVTDNHDYFCITLIDD